jgi:hypothetical protein
VYFCSCLVCTVVILCVLLYCVCIAVSFTLDAGLLARSLYSEGPATGHLDTGFSWFSCALCVIVDGLAVCIVVVVLCVLF